MNYNVLAVVAHSDDEVLGCGGTLYMHAANGAAVHLLVITDGDNSRPNPNINYRYECLKKSCKTLAIQSFKQLDFKDNMLDTYPLLEIVNKIEKEINITRPKIIYTHSEADLNIDHIITNQATLTACRPIPSNTVDKVLTFEVPSSTEWGRSSSKKTFIPNIFFELDDCAIEKKQIALSYYDKEIKDFPHPRSLEYINALAKIRGGSVGVKMAEAFFCERFIYRV